VSDSVVAIKTEPNMVEIALNRSEPYLEGIQAVTAAYRQGEPLSENAKQALQQDMAAYDQLQEQQRQRELEQERQQEFCL
jgi:hypothetical protein